MSRSVGEAVDEMVSKLLVEPDVSQWMTQRVSLYKSLCVQNR